MTNEEKQLILTKDICGRAAYWFDLKVDYNGKAYTPFGFGAGRLSLLESPFMSYTTGYSPLIEEVKPYLRPMSSMTEEEKKEFDKVLKSCNDKVFACPDKERRYNFFDAEQEDFMNAHYFDYRGLIPMGLALEALEDMYKTK